MFRIICFALVLFLLSRAEAEESHSPRTEVTAPRARLSDCHRSINSEDEQAFLRHVREINAQFVTRRMTAQARDSSMENLIQRMSQGANPEREWESRQKLSDRKNVVHYANVGATERCPTPQAVVGFLGFDRSFPSTEHDRGLTITEVPAAEPRASLRCVCRQDREQTYDGNFCITLPDPERHCLSRLFFYSGEDCGESMNLRVDHFTFDAAPGPRRGWHPSRSPRRYFCGRKYVPNEELAKFPTFPESARRESRGWDAGPWHAAGGFRRTH